MTDQHPITPPPELVQQWAAKHWGSTLAVVSSGEEYIAIQAARWGADVELEACCEWLDEVGPAEIRLYGNDLRIDRRPKPKSLAEEALEEVGVFEGMGTCSIDIIRRALERLQELEGQQ